MRRVAAGLWALALATLVCASSRAQDVGHGALRVDGIAAVVGGLAPGPDVISIYESDVELRARMAVLRESDLRAALAELPPELLAASLKELLGEALIMLEATRLNLPPPDGAALAEQRALLVGTRSRPLPARALLDALGVGERELSDWIERRAVVSAFLDANIEGTLEVSESELERLFETEPHPYRGQSFASVRARFASWLSQRRLQRAVERWITTLASRIPHRVLTVY